MLKIEPLFLAFSGRPTFRQKTSSGSGAGSTNIFEAVYMKEFTLVRPLIGAKSRKQIQSATYEYDVEAFAELLGSYTSHGK